MEEKERIFSQTAMRDNSTGRSRDKAERHDKPRAVVVPARLDQRAASTNLPKELGGVKGPEPTRYGDWENKGRCTDF
jgi:hypothetical protein